MQKGSGQVKGFKKRVLELKDAGLSHRKIANKLGCSKSTVSFHLNSVGRGVPRKFPTDDDVKKWNELYKSHGSLKDVARLVGWSVVTITKYVDKIPRKTFTEAERKKNATVAVGKRRRKIKELAVEHKGGACQVCGYNRCAAAMDFHHKDPAIKKFGLSMSGLSRSIDAIRDELDKCVLLCSNCHRELHAGFIELKTTAEWLNKWGSSMTGRALKLRALGCP